MRTTRMQRVLAAVALGVALAATQTPASAHHGFTIESEQHWYSGEQMYLGTSACRRGEVLVGVDGAGTRYVNNVSALCAEISQVTGGNAYNSYSRGRIGRLHNFTQRIACPRGKAVSGFRGSTGWWFDGLSVGCRTLRADGSVSGPMDWRPEMIGANGGSRTFSRWCTNAGAVTGMQEPTATTWNPL